MMIDYLKKIFRLLLASVILVSGIGCREKAHEIVKIGAILPLTGDNASYGLALKEGMDLAFEEVNSKRARKNLPIITPIYEDDAASPQSGVNSFKKLMATDKPPLVIGAMFSAVTLAIAPIAESNKVVLISPTSSSVDLSKAGDYIFRIYPSDSYDGRFLAEFCAHSMKMKKASIVYLQASSTVAITHVFETRFSALGGQILSKDSYIEGTSDFREIINRLKRVKSDFIFLPGYLKEMAVFLRQCKELGLSVPIISISTFNDPKILDLAGGAAEGVIFSTPFYDTASQDSITQNFVKSFKVKFNEEPNIWSGYGYDVVRVAENAIDGIGATSESIKMNLYNMKDFPGVTGNVTFDAEGDVTKQLRVMQVRDGKFVQYGDSQ